MVEQTRRQNHVVSLQAGPGEVDGGALFDVNLRLSNNVTRAVGRQLAVIGDQMMRDLASREPTWPAVPINLFRPAQVLTRTIYRDIHRQLWSFQDLFAALKVWITSTPTGPRTFRDETLTALAAGFNAGWTRGALVAAALVAAVSTFGALCIEWKV
ncbi:bcl-2-interacting killer [Oryzias melastigma]|uniref:bcl-2-interacting killer n=1 Tax=Oryzias melastigma TaxID=30732 RepID=UPI00168D06F4|nr:bcl-2-interacting killer [Oryzias melastigma]